MTLFGREADHTDGARYHTLCITEPDSRSDPRSDTARKESAVWQAKIFFNAPDEEGHDRRSIR